ncbi:MAG: NAD(P)-binding domain-containing protein [Oligoflexus sp.]
MLNFLYYFLSEYIWVIGIVLFIYLAMLGVSDRKVDHRKAKHKWDDTVAKNMHEPLSLHPEIDPNLCAGCGACVRACPEGEIIKLIHHRAVLVEPGKCVGHGECERACPFNAIKLAFGTKTRGMDLPRVDANYETNVKGLYIAGELGGMGLIRNAVKQGKLAADHATKNIKKGAKTDVDVLIIGAGPAGLSASLACATAGVRYICLEQNKFGGTIYNFPRQKVVMSHPIELPGVGSVKFPQNKVSKEQILGLWNHVRKKSRLNIREETKFTGLTRKGGVFIVQTPKGAISTQKVILAMGVRGTPRKLNIPGEEMSKVTYNLLDPEQYQRKWIAVVGGGNAGVEAAQYLARSQYQNKVFLLVRGDVLDRCNEENQQIIFGLQKKGRVYISWNTSVEEVHKQHIFINKEGKRMRLQNDFLFIFAGAELPFTFLKSLGIMIETKYGEPLQTG